MQYRPWKLWLYLFSEFSASLFCKQNLILTHDGPRSEKRPVPKCFRGFALFTNFGLWPSAIEKYAKAPGYNQETMSLFTHGGQGACEVLELAVATVAAEGPFGVKFI